MTKAVLASFLSLVTVVSSAPGQTAPSRIPPEAVTSHAEEVVAVCGQVVSVGCGADAVTLKLAMTVGDERVWIRFANADATALGSFPDRLAGYYVCATGLVTRVESGHEIVITNPAATKPLKTTIAAADVRFGSDAHNVRDPDVRSPTLRKSVRPNDTAGALAAKIQGDVAAMKRFEFNPGADNGATVPVVVSGEMTFTVEP